MKCLIYFGMSSMKEGTSAQLSGRGELHGGARVTTLVTLRKCTLGNKREIKTLKFVLASTKGFKGGLAWIKPSKKDMAVTFSYSLKQMVFWKSRVTRQLRYTSGWIHMHAEMLQCFYHAKVTRATQWFTTHNLKEWHQQVRQRVQVL